MDLPGPRPEPQLEARLLALAERAPALPPRFADQVRAARRRRLRTGAGGGLLTIVVVAIIVAIPSLRPFSRTTTGSPQTPRLPVAAWPARGPMVGQPGLAAEVAQDWTRDGGVALTDVAVLYAGPVAGTRFVVARGLTPAGALRVGFFSSAGAADPVNGATPVGPLWLRGEFTPDPAAAVLSIATNYLGSGKGVQASGSAPVVAFALGAPGTADVNVSSTTIDDQMIEGGVGHRHMDVSFAIMFPDSISVTDTVSRWDADGHETSMPVDISGIGEPTVPAAVTVTNAGHVTLDVGATQGVAAGDLVMTRTGLLGEVDTVTAATATAVLVSDPVFHIRAVSDITHVPGQVNHRTGGALRFTATDPTQQYEVNRVVTDTTPAVTIGFAPGGTATSVPPLTPAVTGAVPATVTVLIVPAAR